VRHPGQKGGITAEYVPIESIKVGDKVFTHLGKSCTVTSTMSRDYEGKLIKIVIPWRGVSTISRVIECTPEHPFLTQQGWKKAEDLTTEDVLYTYKDIHHGHPLEINRIHPLLVIQKSYKGKK